MPVLGKEMRTVSVRGLVAIGEVEKHSEDDERWARL